MPTFGAKDYSKIGIIQSGLNNFLAQRRLQEQDDIAAQERQRLEQERQAKMLEDQQFGTIANQYASLLSDTSKTPEERNAQIIGLRAKAIGINPTRYVGTANALDFVPQQKQTPTYDTRNVIDAQGKPVQTKVGDITFNVMEKYDANTGNAIPKSQTFVKVDDVNRGTGLPMGTDPKQIADAIESGIQPPTLQGLYRAGGAVRTELAKRGYDLSRATTDWQSVQKHFATLNNPQQTRLRQAAQTAYDSFNVIEELANKWQGGKFPLLNKASLTLAKNGAYGQEAQSIAVQLEAQINDVVAEMSQVYMAGNTPTDQALKQASKNLSADWSLKTLKDALNLGRRNMQIRLNSINNVGVLSPSGNANPYYPQNNTGTQLQQSQQKVDSFTPQQKTLTKKQYSQSANKTKLIYSDGTEEIVDGRQ